MADFNRHLKHNKILVFFTIFAFLYMSCFTSCSKSGKQERTEVAQRSAKVEKPKKNGVLKAETAGNQETTESSKSAQSEKNDEPCAGCPPGAKSSAENAGQKKPPTQQELNQMADKLNRYFQALEESVKDIPRDTFDPQAIVDKVGKDPDALFKWVRDNTFLVPYKGMLRGPVGVLMDRMGNSLDRALLLCELLRLSGKHTRLARVQLNGSQAETLLGEVRNFRWPAETRKPAYDQTMIEELTEKLATKYVLDKKALAQAIGDRIKAQEQLAARIDFRVSQQSQEIFEATKALRARTRAENADEKARSLQDHWWTQVENAGGWVDLDPSFRESSLNRPQSEQTDYFEPKNLPRELFHRIIVKITIEQCTADKCEEKVVLTKEFKASEVNGQKIVIKHVPVNWPTNMDFFNNEQGKSKFLEALLAQKEWLPCFAVGQDITAESSFLDTGEINKNPGQKRGPAGIGGLSKGIFGALGGGEDESSQKVGGDLTAEWIDFQIISPGQKAKDVRRAIFDLIGRSKESPRVVPSSEIIEVKKLARNLALLGETEILIQAAGLAADFVCNATVQSALSNEAQVTEALRGFGTLKAADLNKIFKKINPPTGHLFQLAQLRMNPETTKNRIFLGSPNIIAFHQEIKVNEQQALFGRIGFDIVDNEIDITGIPDENTYQARLQQGIRDTFLEAAVLSETKPAAENVSELYSQSKDLLLEWTVIADNDDLKSKQLEIKPERLIKISRDLEQGYAVIVPTSDEKLGKGSYFGWWRLNPRTGNLLGVGENGEGGGEIEYAVLVQWIMFWGGGAVAICAAGLWDGMEKAAENYQQHKDQSRYEQEKEQVLEKYRKCLAIAALGSGGFLLYPATTVAELFCWAILTNLFAFIEML